MGKNKLIKGTFVYTTDKDSFDIVEDGYIKLDENGRITDVMDGISEGQLEKIREEYEVIDYTGKLIIPAFTDLHMHPFQYPLIGNGYDKELLPWCRLYCGPAEELSLNPDFARKTCRLVMEELKKYGLLHAVMFPTMEYDNIVTLFDEAEKSGLYVYAGKSQDDMPLFDREAYETTEESMKNAILLAKRYADNDKVKYMFVTGWSLDASDELMLRIGKAAREYNMGFHSHLDENRTEVKWVLERHPDCETYADTYNKNHVFGEDVKTVMAHCIHTTEHEIELLRDNQVYVAHCPHSNFNLASGVMRLRRYLDCGIRVGLGSDISAGHTLNMFDIMRNAIEASKIYYVTEGLKPVTGSEAFYLATKSGGSFFGMRGSFEKGYQFDALVLEDSFWQSINSVSTKERIERMIYRGDDRNIVHRYLDGEEI